MWFSVERDRQEQATGRKFAAAVRVLKAMAGDNSDKVDTDPPRGRAWWGTEDGAPRLIEKGENQSIVPLAEGFRAAGLDLEDFKVRFAAQETA